MNGNYDDDTGELIAKIADKDAEIKRLEAEAKRLKCCGNCDNYHQSMSDSYKCSSWTTNYDFPAPNFKCGKWEDRK